MKRAYVSPEVDVGLLSGKRLRNDNLWMVIPPKDLSPNIGTIVSTTQGEVIMTGDDNFMVDLNQIGLQNQKIKLPDISPVIRANAVNRVYGYKPNTISDLVMYFHYIGHWNRDTMIWMSESGAIDFWPISAYQIRKYFINDCIHCIQGGLRNRKVDASYFIPKHDTKPKSSQPSSAQDTKTLLPTPTETRNLVPGYEIDIDPWGPLVNLMILSASDKATGFGMNVKLPRTAAKKNIHLAIEQLITFCEQCGKHEKSWNKPIATMVMDSDVILKSKECDKLFDANKIIPKRSPPHVHEYNGLIEHYNQTVEILCTTFYAAKPYAPLSLWRHAWDQANRMLNLKKTNRPNINITRYEDFTGEKYNMRKLPLHPMFQIVEVIIPKPYRKKMLQKSITAMYCGPSMHIDGGIVAYIPDINRTVDRVTYRIHDVIPPH